MVSLKSTRWTDQCNVTFKVQLSTIIIINHININNDNCNP